MFVRKVETSKKVFPKNIYRKTISIDKDGVCIRRAGEPDAAGADGHGRDDDERVRLRSGEPADLVGRHEQRGEPAVNERDVCVQRAGTARDARGGRGRHALLLHGLCAAVHDGERVRIANAEHPRPVGYDRGEQAV